MIWTGYFKKGIDMVKSDKLYTPQEYVEAITGNCYAFPQDDTIAEIEAALESNGCGGYWSYPLSEIGHIAEMDIDVVLVDVSGFDEEGEWRNAVRWFEVPDDFAERKEE